MAMRYNSQIVNDGLVLCLDAGNSKSYVGSGTTWIDLIKTGVVGSINGASFDATNGGSISFDGINDYVDVSLKFFNTQKFSMGMWINVTSFTNTGTYLACAVSNGQYTIFGPTNSYQTYSNTFSGAIQINATTNAIATVTQSGYATNTWYHYCAVYDGSQTGNSNRFKIYINGVSKTLVFDATIPSTAYSVNSTALLGFQINATAYKYFNGKIGNFSLYSRPISDLEVLQNYNATRRRFGV